MNLIPAALKEIAVKEVVSKGATKVINTVVPYFGYLTKPGYEDRMNRTKARAGIHELAVRFEMEEMEANQAVVRMERDIRISERLRQLEERRQDNLDAIAVKAVEAATEEPNDEPVEEDWMYKFMESCQDVGDEEMQSLWARMLAGEVATPGKYSARTLSCVRIMSKDDADMFTRMCSCLWKCEHLLRTDTPPYIVKNIEESPFIFDVNTFRRLDGIDLDFNDLIHMKSLGLIHCDTASFVKRYDLEPGLSYFNITIQYFDKTDLLLKEVNPAARTFDFKTGLVALTDIGKQLAPISGAEPNDGVRRLILQQFIDRGWSVNLSHLPDPDTTTTA